MARALITMPASATRGEIVEIRTLVNHPMETGYRRGGDGELLRRNLIRRFSCTLDGELVFGAELHAAVAANPYIAFHVAATAGTLTFTWEGDEGFVQTETRTLTIA